MKQKKTVFLFLALILPICIFLFLKFFGKNEFAVEPLYVDVYPEMHGRMCRCQYNTVFIFRIAYRVQLPFQKDSLVIVLIW